MNKPVRIGMDTSKSVFQLHGVDENETVVVRRQFRRTEMIRYFEKLPPALVAIEERPCLHGVLSSRTLQSRNNVAILRLNSWFRFGPRFSPHRAGYILEALNFSNPTERKCLPLFCRGFRNDFRDRRSFVSASRSPHAFATACAPERHLVLQGKINAQPARQVVVGSRSKGPISSGFYWFRTPAS